MEAVRFGTYDDVELAAQLYLPEKREGWSPAIIVCHGFGSRKENYADFGPRAAAVGFAALLIDLRGHGESGGAVDGNIFNDVAAALEYLQNRAEVNPMSIAIRGSSMGGWLAIHTAAYLRDLSTVAAYCPASEAGLIMSVEQIALQQRGGGPAATPGDLPRVNVNSTLELLYRLDLFKAARRIHPRPFLLVHCEGDEVVPVHISQRLYDAAQEPKTLWLVPDGDHGFAQHNPETDARLLEWLSVNRPKTGNLYTGELSEDSEQ
jgi:dienelactone hydrolase